MLTSCLGLFWSVTGHATATVSRDALLLEFVQDMAWLEDSKMSASAEADALHAHVESMNSFFAGAQARLLDLAPLNFSSLEPVSEALAAHQRLINQLGAAGTPVLPDATPGIALAKVSTTDPSLHIRLENLSQNYLHLAQLVMFDELADSDRHLTISAETKQRILAFVARYPVDKEDANGYLSAMWFIRENLKKWKCEDEV